MYWWTLQTHWLLLWLLQLVRQNYFVYPLCVICYSDKNTRAVWDGTPTARNNDTKNHSHFVLLTNEWATIISLRRKDRTTTEYIIWEVKKQEFFSSSIHCELAAKWSSHSIMSFFFLHFIIIVCTSMLVEVRSQLMGVGSLLLAGIWIQVLWLGRRCRTPLSYLSAFSTLPPSYFQFYIYFVVDIYHVSNIWKMYRFVKYRENALVITWFNH